jgi:two-component system sensor histidine kinase YesM
MKNLIKFMLPMFIPLIVLGAFSFFVTQNYIRNDINKNNLKMLNQAKESIELIFNDLDSLSLNYKFNPSYVVDFKSILNGTSINDYDSMQLIRFFQNSVDPPVNSKAYIQSIYVYFENKSHNFLASNQGIVQLNDFLDKSWYTSFLNQKENVNIWTETRDTKLFGFESENTHLITIYQKLLSEGLTKADGVIVMNIKINYIENILRGLVTYPDQAILILDENADIVSKSSGNLDISQSDIQKINNTASNFFEYKSMKDSYIVSQIQSSRYHLKFVSSIPKQALYKIPTQLIYFTASLLFVSFLLGLIIAYYITRKNYRNIVNIIATFELAEKGSPLPELPSRINDEYGFIMQNIIKTFIEQSYLNVQLSEKKYKLKAMELMALQSQINPHFLFNTLQTIFWKSISLTGEQNEVSKMLEYLSDILHYSLGNSDKTVTLEEEIKFAQSYIEIQKVRYKGKFRVILEYDDDIVQCNVIKLLFQPLIENCIYHGIKEKEGPGFIKIKIRKCQSLIKISIIDNGIGIEQGMLRKIRGKLAEESEYSEHIGLFNTNKRLKLHYGEEYGLRINSKLGLGTVVYINFPV